MTADLHAHLMSLADQSIPEGQAVAKLLSDHAPTEDRSILIGIMQEPGHRRIICQGCLGLPMMTIWPCPLVRDLARILNGKTTLTLPECVVAGGHHWFDGARGVSVSHALHEQFCVTCTAVQNGQKLLYRNNAVIEWDEPADRRINA
jgi:hypothetical protein